MNDDIDAILASQKRIHAPQPGPGDPTEGSRLIAPGIIVRPGHAQRSTLPRRHQPARYRHCENA